MFTKRLLILVLLLVPSLAHAQTATVTWATLNQTVDGFGAYSNYLDGIFSPTQATQLFSTTSGAGLSLLRTQVPDGGPNHPGNCSSIGTGCSGTVSNLTQAQALGAQIWATSWTPPASMKSNGAVICNTGSGPGSLLSGSYGAFATWQSNYIASLSAVGVPLYAISVQNEPDFCPTTYEGASMTAAQFDTYVKTNLGPTLVANGQSSTLIVMPETSVCSNLASYANTAFTDSSALPYLGVAACHDYIQDGSGKGINLSQSAYPNASNNDKRYWQTEVYGQLSGNSGTYDPSISDALAWANQIHNWMTVANANAWHWWTILGGGGNESLYPSDTSTTPAKRLWAIGNFARFVRPGWIRIGATANPQSGVLVSAYKSGSSFAFVVINQNSSATSQTFALSGFSAASVTPWVTSSTLNLAQQSAVSVSGTSFTYSLPAQSITTFVGTESSTGTIFYVAANGSDSNSGLTKSSPLLHAHQMTGCTANCLGHAPVPGDAYILRGGDTWHNVGTPQGLPWTTTYSGSPGSPIYYGGGDETWQNGSCSNTGIVDTNGTQVLLAAYGENTVGHPSDPFVPQSNWNGAAPSSWIGGTITINGVGYTIQSVQNPWQLTLTTSAGTQRGVTYTNSLWCRPTLSMDGQLMNSGNGSMVTMNGLHDLVFDMFEIIGVYWDDTTCFTDQPMPGGDGKSLCNSMINFVASQTLGSTANVTVSNNYWHKWSHSNPQTKISNPQSTWMLWMGSNGGVGLGQNVYNNSWDGSDSLDTTTFGTGGTVINCNSNLSMWPEGLCATAGALGFEGYSIHDNHVKYMANGFVINNAHLFYNNLVELLRNTNEGAFWAGQHGNSWELQGTYPGTALYYNNLTRLCNIGVVTWINPESPDTIYLWNNVWYGNNSGGQDFDQCNAPVSTSCSNQPGQAVLWNNTIQPSPSASFGWVHSGISYTTFGSNFWITNTGTSKAVAGTVSANEVTMTPATAASNGYTAANSYAPTLATAPTVGVAPNRTSSCSTVSTALCSDTTNGDTHNPVSRPTSGNWDAGAFQFVSGAPSPTATLSPGSFNYGNVNVGSSASNTFTFSNTGSVVVNIAGSPSVTGHFSITSTTCGSTLATGTSCTITVAFNPNATGAFSGTLSVSSNAVGSPQTSSLSGTGIAPTATWAPTSYNFGSSTPVGTPTFSSSIVLTNGGTSTLNISLTTTGTGYSISSTTCGATLAPSASCGVVVQFIPPNTSVQSGTLVETDSVNSVTATATLSGQGASVAFISAPCIVCLE